MEPLCPVCHVVVRPTDYFCYNCGKNLHPKPLSVSLQTQLMYYAGSVMLPPMGVIWGIKYLKEQNTKAKVVGSICIILTIIVIVVAVQSTIALINTVNSQINTQMMNFQGM